MALGTGQIDAAPGGPPGTPTLDKLFRQSHGKPAAERDREHAA